VKARRPYGCDKPKMPEICDVGGQDEGLLLPRGGDWEANWPNGVKIALYLIGLIWCFMGVALISDVFMGAIERVTSKQVLILDKTTGKKITVKVWNDTVANLSLMALGSSAPEILLSIIGLLSQEFYSEDLGPSTIVGSAAFNLLCIIAICIVSLPDGEVRQIKETGVYAITSSFSVFAYLWLIVILMLITPNVVDIWEGLVTFLFFPMLLSLAYLADIGVFSRASKKEKNIAWADISRDSFAELEMRIRQQHGSALTDSQIQALLQFEYSPPLSRAVYRVASTRRMFGGKKILDDGSNNRLEGARLTSMVDVSARFTGSASSCVSPSILGRSNQGEPCTISFAADRYSVMESTPVVRTTVVRAGDLSGTVSVQYATREGTATKNTDYAHSEGVLKFLPQETHKQIEVQIIDDSLHETNEVFFLDLRKPSGEGRPKLGKTTTATIMIVDDDEPGVFSFEQEQLFFQESSEEFSVSLIVRREHGCSGKSAVSYRTEDATAFADHDYKPVQGLLEFEHGQVEGKIDIVLLPKGRYERTENFRVYLSDPTNGAKLNAKADGGTDSNICTIFIKADPASRDRTEKLITAMKLNWDQVQIGHANWYNQIIEAILVGGSWEGLKEASIFDWVVHLIVFPWKLVFAIVPPCDYLNGWLCFFTSLCMIGFVTALIGDMASLLGCAMGISKSITAITFVALGTSLPDTFASKTAAQQDPYADASVGNVTGSNSVNVFLGLGLPWSVGAFYWYFQGATEEWKEAYPDQSVDYPDGGFVVVAGTLGPCVAVFTGCALSCLLLLAGRRHFFGGELGGHKASAYASAACLVALWFVYIGLSIYIEVQ